MNYVVQHLPKIYALGIGLSAISCFARADFNLPLFIYAYIILEYQAKDDSVIIKLVWKIEDSNFDGGNTNSWFDLDFLLGATLEFSFFSRMG